MIGVTGDVWLRTEGTSFVVPSFEFDGRRFDALMGNNAAAAPCLYLAYQARRGDGVAADVLNACMVTIRDVDGKTYWPMESKE